MLNSRALGSRALGSRVGAGAAAHQVLCHQGTSLHDSWPRPLRQCRGFACSRACHVSRRALPSACQTSRAPPHRRLVHDAERNAGAARNAAHEGSGAPCHSKQFRRRSLLLAGAACCSLFRVTAVAPRGRSPGTRRATRRGASMAHTPETINMRMRAFEWMVMRLSTERSSIVRAGAVRRMRGRASGVHPALDDVLARCIEMALERCSS